MAPSFTSILLSWDFDPLVTVALLLAAGLYALGCVRFHRRMGRLPVPTWRVWLYGFGIASLVLALLSPIHTFDSLLFSVHMLEHLLVVLAAAPLLLFGAPVLPTLWAFPDPERKQIAKLLLARGGAVHAIFHFLTQPLVAVGLFVACFAGWHIPVFYDAAQGVTVAHSLEHSLFFGTALLFWWGIIHPTGGKRRVPYGVAAISLFPPLITGIFVGALLTFASSPIYSIYRDAPRIFGLSALEDQQLAGLIMWVPTGVYYLVALLILLSLLLRDEESRTVKAQRMARGYPAAAEAHSPTGSAS